MDPEPRTVEQVIAEIASVQHGVVTRAQLLDAGFSPQVIRRRVRKGGLLRMHRGVYRAGHRAPSNKARYLAAVLACGEDALLSGCGAGHLRGLVKWAPSVPEVIAPTERRVPGVRTRRYRKTPDSVVFDGIPVATVAWILVDLATSLGRDSLARACHEAGVRYGTTPTQVEAVLASRPRAKGAATLRAIMHGDTKVTLSKLEKRFVALLRDNDLSLPITNKLASGRRVDCRWPDLALTVELDSYTYHSSRHAWQRDRQRDREAYARGDEIRRYTSTDVFDDPRHMLRELRALLIRGGPRRRRGGPALTRR